MNRIALNPPDGLELWQFGRRKNWGRLGDWLKAERIEDVSVTSKIAEERMSAVCRLVEESKDRGTDRNLILTLLACGKADQGLRLLKRVLALGVRPNDVDKAGLSPIQLAAANPISSVGLEALLMCRPELGRIRREEPLFVECEGSESSVPKLRNAAMLLEKVTSSGFSSIAMLVSEREYWAVKNICRRRLVAQEEFSIEFNGKTAVQWAETLDQKELAAELRYFQLDLSSGGQPTLEAPAPGPSIAVCPAGSIAQPSFIENNGSDLERPVMKDAGFTKTQSRNPVVLEREVAALRDRAEVQEKEVNKQGRSLESLTHQLAGLIEVQLQVTARIRDIEEKLNAGEKLVCSLPLSNQDPERSQGSRRRAMIGELLHDLGAIADADASYELIQDLLELAKKHGARE